MSHFTCPVCGEKLNKIDRSYRCANGHCHDIAKEGYVHLLPVQKMHSKLPGDAPEMVMARREFLDAGYYDCFRKKLSELVFEELKEKESPVIVDAGCGEGAYDRFILDCLKEKNITPELSGFDISKTAARYAAKKCKEAEFAVGSIFHSPVESNCADCLLSVFAPIVPEEFLRIVKPGGVVIIAVAGGKHLYELKKIVYDKPYENEYKETEYHGFSFVKRIPVRDTITITPNKQIQNVFTMTPYYFKTSPADKAKLNTVSELTTEIEFDFLVYRKN